MNREEKNQQTRQRILDAALQEFGEKSYAEASLNTVCKADGVSKGIIYHYFKDKDELFLACVQECFDALTAQLKESMASEGESVEQMMQRYFDSRVIFFDENPLYLKLFCSAVILPPPHLIAPIAEIRKSFDELNITVLTSMLHKVPLRGDVTLGEVIEEFKLYQDFVNAQYQMQTIHQLDMKEHEKRCTRTLKILLYGVIERN